MELETLLANSQRAAIEGEILPSTFRPVAGSVQRRGLFAI